MFHRFAIALLIVFPVMLGIGSIGQAGDLQFIAPDKSTGTSGAVIVPNQNLAHTAQLLPLDKAGRLVGKNQVKSQIRQALENLKIALESAEANLKRIVKINVYAANDAVVKEAKTALAKQFTGNASLPEVHRC